MGMQLRGVVKGTQIELEREIGLPDGSCVNVEIEKAADHETDLEKLRGVVNSLCGAWADDESIEPLFAEIERDRANSAARPVNFDAPP